MNVISSYRHTPAYTLHGNTIKRPEKTIPARFSSQVAAPAHDKTILIVDDEEDNREYLVDVLKYAVGDSYNIETAKNDEEAQTFINKCTHKNKLLIYLDKNLGHASLDGVTLAQKWKKEGIKRYQVIFTSTEKDLPSGWQHYPKGSEGFSVNIINAARQFLYLLDQVHA